MPAEFRPGIEGHVAKRFGLGGIYNFPDVDIHLAKYHLELVDQRDVHGAENILLSFTASAVSVELTGTVTSTTAP